MVKVTEVSKAQRINLFCPLLLLLKILLMLPSKWLFKNNKLLIQNLRSIKNQMSLR